MSRCANHTDHEAIEQCEVCGTPLCGECLWYTHDGHRLCAGHAAERRQAGEEVLPPETYQEAFRHGIRPAPGSAGPGTDPPGVYRGNQHDLLALFAGLAGIATLVICSGVGAYCLPLVGVIMGLISYSRARDALDPPRTRVLSLVGVFGSSALLAFMALIVLFYCGVISMALLSANP